MDACHGHERLWFACAAIACCSLAFWLLRSLVWRPASQRRALLQNGVYVPPFRLLGGDLPEIRRLEATARLSSLPSPSDHHLVFRHVYPFLHKRISQLQHADRPFAIWLFNQPIVIITDPEHAKLIFSSDVKHFQKYNLTCKVFQAMFGRGGLLFADGEDWHSQRSLLRQAFLSERLKEMIADMVISALEMAKIWCEHLDNKEGRPNYDLEVSKDLKNVAADILARTSFGSSYLRGRSIFEKQVEILDLLMNDFALNIVIPGYRHVPTSANRRLKILEREVNKELSEIVESCRKTLLTKDGIQQSSTSDLLSLMLLAEEREVKYGCCKTSLTTQQVIAECKTFFFAGHESTANLLAWTMVLLASNPEWQQRAREEVFSICGKQEGPKADHLGRMKIVGMVLNESLRLYPPLPNSMIRILSCDGKSFDLGSIILPEGAGVVVLPLYIHRRKDVWGEDADEFNPMRFANGIANACNHPQGFMPFWQGPRNCIGSQFAVMEAKVVMAIILQRFKFSLSPNYRHSPVVTITMRPKHGVQVILEPSRLKSHNVCIVCLKVRNEIFSSGYIDPTATEKWCNLPA